MSARNESKIAFPDEEKESISTRLRSLIGKRSVRAAAQDWGLSFSTLNNYLTRGTEPSLNVAIKISDVENVSVEWLATGKSAARVDDTTSEHSGNSPTKNAWLMVFDSLDDSDATALIRAIHRKGVEGLLSAAQESLDAEDAIDKLQIRATLKQAIKMALAGDESTDQEILRRLSLAEHSSSTGAVTEANQEQSKKIAG
ncbi:helix-turn-helix domain-containing protein [Serratia marcescens]|uniref:helix-turn-helix domain-containing protein n=1 Tax=Serratia marcescens TaxID=615 RepID=UPI001EF80616|nr:helix-turn-helix transcriptional regulator [Serratia marcescens]